MIISASRRTDIPAFYSQWLINRMQAGFVLSRNPYNARQISRISLQPQDISAIVFWSRNPTPLLPYLDWFDQQQINYYFQFTLTGYPRELERGTPPIDKALSVFQQLAQRLGKARVIWRYDPILICNLLSTEQHRRLFAQLSEKLADYTEQVVISFADIYHHVTRSLARVDGLIYHDLNSDRQLAIELSQQLAEIARDRGLTISACAEDPAFLASGIIKAKCIDEQLLNRLFGLELSGSKDKGQRELCGCIKSVDIGAYHSCLHDCRYCYATYNSDRAKRNYQQHNPLSPFLIGD